MKKIIIVGAGFAGLNVAKILGNFPDVEVTVIDKRNHHLFQPLLYQVALAALSPAEIAVPIRSILSKYKNIKIIEGEVTFVDKVASKIKTDFGELSYDYLVLACGAQHSYFGNNHWEEYAPGLKNIEQATEIRRRVLKAFEIAERQNELIEQKKYLTFAIVGGGPTGVELAGAIAEISRFTLSKDFKNINPAKTRILLIEGGPRILPSFDEKLSQRATKDLNTLGVDVMTSSMVTNIDSEGVEIQGKKIQTKTILWAAGVQPSDLNQTLDQELDRQGRVIVEKDLSIQNYKNIFVAGDQAHVKDKNEKPLPGMAPVAVQQGCFIANNIIREIKGKPRTEFKYFDKGQMATIGKSKAVVQVRNIKFGGFFAWLIWLFIHVYYLTGFKNKLFVVIEWGWSYLSFKRGARLIVDKEWRMHPPKKL